MDFRLTVDSSRNQLLYLSTWLFKVQINCKTWNKSLASLQSFQINQKLEISIFIEICIYVGKTSHSAPSWRHLAAWFALSCLMCHKLPAQNYLILSNKDRLVSRCASALSKQNWPPQMHEAVCLSKARSALQWCLPWHWLASNKQVPQAVGDRVEASVVACINISCSFFGWPSHHACMSGVWCVCVCVCVCVMCVCVCVFWEQAAYLVAYWEVGTPNYLCLCSTSLSRGSSDGEAGRWRRWGRRSPRLQGARGANKSAAAFMKEAHICCTLACLAAWRVRGLSLRWLEVVFDWSLTHNTHTHTHTTHRHTRAITEAHTQAHTQTVEGASEGSGHLSCSVTERQRPSNFSMQN